MNCTLQNLSEEYFNVFMTNFIGVLGQISSLFLSIAIVYPVYTFYSIKLKSMLQNVKMNMYQQTETE